eukprot:TRINITY_DN64685_c0_g1_i1.p3 TRINITY_DN64685_c0_g1~~TRINITY_DN64685_c0_g1_i1.p3  ORF type:complete len:105 (+),score=9.91 TRINITY_DN64685_c0_g1_i1:37-315(+)
MSSEVEFGIRELKKKKKKKKSYTTKTKRQIMKKLFVILVAAVTIGLASCVDDNLTEIEQNVPEFQAPSNDDPPASGCPTPGACGQLIIPSWL